MRARKAAQRAARLGQLSIDAAPPDLAQTGEVEVRPLAGEVRGRAALVAGEGAALAHRGVDGDRQAELGGQDRRRLQGPPVGAGDQPAQRLAAQPLGRARAPAPRRARSAADRAGRHRCGWRRNARSRPIRRGGSAASRGRSADRAVGGGPDGAWVCVDGGWLQRQRRRRGRRAGLVDKHPVARQVPARARAAHAGSAAFVFAPCRLYEEGYPASWRDPSRVGASSQCQPAAGDPAICPTDLPISTSSSSRWSRRSSPSACATCSGARPGTSGRGPTRSASAPRTAATTMSCRCPSAAPTPPGDAADPAGGRRSRRGRRRGHPARRSRASIPTSSCRARARRSR